MGYAGIPVGFAVIVVVEALGIVYGPKVFPVVNYCGLGLNGASGHAGQIKLF
jgi:hypothetical protein